MQKHKISIRPGSYGPFAMVAYEHIQEVGLEYLEVDAPVNTELLKDMLEDEDLKFKIGSFVFPIETDDPTVIDRFKKACEVCKDIEYDFFFSSTKTKGDFEKNKEEGYKVLHQLGEIAQSYGKIISMETHPPYCMNAAQMLETIEKVNHPAIKINFDTANIYYYTKLKPGEGIDEMEKVVDHIGSMHLKESNGGYKTWFFPELGHPGGIVDFKRIFEILEKHNFTGVSTIELEGTKEKPSNTLTMDEAKEIVKKSADYLKKIGVL
jgi:L-ribulose-5-phosphate 3-epimerase